MAVEKTETADRAARPYPPLNFKLIYRFDWPRDAFLTLALFSPRAPVRGALGGAALRAARFTFLRSSLVSRDLVFAMIFVFSLVLKFCRREEKAFLSG
jgi:hypothetical protein